MTDFFSTPDDFGEIRQSELHASLGERLGAETADTLDPAHSLMTARLFREARKAQAGGMPAPWNLSPDDPDLNDQIIRQSQAAVPDTAIADAKARVKQEGLEGHLKLPDQPSIKSPVLDLMVNEAHERRDRELAIAQGPQGFIPGALGLVTSLGAGMIDPINIAAFSIPVLGEARMGRIMASAGDSILNRTGARVLQGGLQGAAGTAALQPADWWLHTHDGQDFTFADALKSVMMGAGMGAGFHASFGAIGDARARWRGAPLPGSPEDLLLRGLMTGTHVHADQLHEDGVPIHDVPGISPTIAPERPFPGDVPLHPAEVMADLPPAAQEDLVRVAIADVAADRPVRSAEVLQIAADHDPRIAESFDAWHGSPHEIDRFSTEHIGTGEGAQAYGHGLYFAENEKVARQYQRSTAGADFVRKAQELYDESDGPGDAHAAIAESKDFTAGQKQLLLALEKDDWLGFDYPHEAVSAALSDPHGKNWEMSPETLEAIKHVGNLYKVRIGANRDHFLDWDKPIAEQSEHVRNALENHPDEMISGTASKWGHDVPAMYGRIGQRLNERFSEEYASARADLDAAEAALQRPLPPQSAFRDAGKARERMIELERKMNSHQAASKSLSEAGIPGIKYLDQASRPGPGAMTSAGMKLQAPPKTHNFVVFDDKHIQITHKNGEAVGLDQFKASPEAASAPADAGARIPDLAAPAPAPKRGRAGADPQTWSLFEHLASVGGLKPTDDLQAIFGNTRGPFVPGFGPLLRKSGKSVDDALIAAKEGGYFIDPTDPAHARVGDVDQARQGRDATFGPRDLLEKIDEESRGRKQYRANHLEATKYDPEQEKHVIMGALETELAKAGEDVSAIDPKLLNRAVEITHREGVSDVLDAYERAIMEDSERYDAIANARRDNPATADIPGFDDRGATPGDGGRDSLDNRQAGRPDQSGRRADDPQSRSHGARAAAAADDPRWRELADVRPAEQDPEVLAQSREADRLAEPDSLVPETSLTALEKQAADAEAIWRKLEPTLTEKERVLVNDVLDQLKLDKEARDKVITDGAACLVGAIG